MALCTIREIGDLVLNQRVKRIQSMTPRLKIPIADVVEAMWAANSMGLAVPQVDILKRLVVTECEEGEFYVLINPEITGRDDEQTGYEGCPSAPGKTGIATRPMHVIIKALNEKM